jgi:hypothetical protein
MEKILLKPLRSEVQYHGIFAAPAFSLLSRSATLLENILKHLGKYGANLNSIAVDSLVPNANVACSLVDLGTIVRIRLDRLEISFVRFHHVGEPTAKQIFLDSYAALQKTPDVPGFTEHLLNVHLYAEIVNGSYIDIIQRYVKTPEVLGENVEAGVVFYLPGDQSQGERQGSIVIDRLVGQGRGMDLRINLSLDARAVAAEDVSERIDNFVNRQIERLGFTLVVEQKS